MIAECRCQHARAHDNPRRFCAERAKPRKGERRVSVGVAPGLEMIANENRIEAGLLGKTGEIEKFARSELFGRGFVSKSKHARGLSRAWPAANRPLLRRRAACQAGVRMPT